MIYCFYFFFFSKIIPSFFTIKEGSTSLLGLLPLRREEGNRPTRCSEPLRSKVGGPSKVFAMLCGMEPHGAIGACIEELHLSVLPY